MRSPLRIVAAAALALSLPACVRPHRTAPAPVVVAAPPPRPEIPPTASPLFAAVADAAWREAVARPGSGLVLASADNDVDPHVLVSSTVIFPAMADAIASARGEVLFQTYKLQADSDPAEELFRGIARLQTRVRAEGAADGPVIVRILVDAWTIRRPGTQLIPSIEKKLADLKLDPHLVEVEIAANRHAGPKTLHSKTLVVDGRVAIVTGGNPDRDHDYDAPWHDTGYRMEGAVARALRDEFGQAWRDADEWTCGMRVPTPERQCFAQARALPTDPVVDDIRPVSGHEVPALVLVRAARGGLTAKHAGDPLTTGLLAAIGGATREVRIASPNLNAHEAVEAIAAAARRGVAVDLLLSRGFRRIGERLPGQGGDNEEVVAALYRHLSDEGVAQPCKVLHVRWYSANGVSAVVGTGPHANHDKYVSVDGHLAFVGSANFDTQSWVHSREVDVAVDDARVVSAWDAQGFAPAFERSVPVDECRTGTTAEAR